MSTPKYLLSSIEAWYGTELGVAVDDLRITAGQLHLLVGPNGSGKSTLLNVLAFLLTPNAGEIRFDGNEVKWTPQECAALRRRITLVHQHPFMFSGTVASNVAFGLAARGASKEQTARVVRESLERVGLAGFETRIARKLSGGEIRRVGLARALACSPEVLLLDEPLAHLDRASFALVESLVVSLAADGMTIVMSTHSKRLLDRLGANVIRLEDGRLNGTTESTSIDSRPR
jgi:tungstate transport system ATP-binding protein